jgi:hypothetical protein
MSREYRASPAGGETRREVVILEYRSEYEKKREVMEVVVEILEPDGAWRVGAYTIRK